MCFPDRDRAGRRATLYQLFGSAWLMKAYRRASQSRGSCGLSFSTTCVCEWEVWDVLSW